MPQFGHGLPLSGRFGAATTANTVAREDEAMAMTLDEILTELAAHVGDDKAKGAEVGNAIREKIKPVSQHLINVGSALKKEEAKAEVKKLTEERDAAIAERDEAAEALATSNAAKPDVAKLEADLTAKWSKKVDDLKKQLGAKDESFRGALRKSSIAKLTAELVKAGVDPDYAKEVLAAKYSGQFEVKDDGSVVVKNGDGLEYDGDEDTKVGAFAADLRKIVPPKFINTNADTGAGVRNGQGGGSGYDAAKVGAEMGKQEREAATATSGLAFK